MRLEPLAESQFEAFAESLGIVLPVEQSVAWNAYQVTIPGRNYWGSFALFQGSQAVGVVTFLDFETHGYHYLRTTHAPVWAPGVDVTPELEAEMLEAITAEVRKRDRKVVFVRLAVLNDLPACEPLLSTVSYDKTVVIDLTGGDEAILSRMKPRGRRDVRKALREAPITCADETAQALVSFDEYYDVMVETAERDDFVPSPASDYVDMLSVLGSEHCRLFAGRNEAGEVVTWSIITISGTQAVRYYAASRTATMRQYVSDKLCYFECCELARLGCVAFDLMGIGSDFSPSLNGLNTFKTKFSKEVADVAPLRDLPIKRMAYKGLQTARDLRDKLHAWRTPEE